MDEAIDSREILPQLCAAVVTGRLASPRDLSLSLDGVNAVQWAEGQRVVPLLAAGLILADQAGVFPEAIDREQLRRRVRALARQVAHAEEELAFISGLLASAGVRFLVCKGPALARQAYPVPEWRVYDDLDLWVESRDLVSALHALEKGGYQRWQSLGSRIAACAHRAGIEVAMRHPERGRLIELAHGWRALGPTRPAARAIRDSAVSLEIAGTRIQAPAAVHALLLACAHGAHHGWDRFIWLADVAGLWLRLSRSERDTACRLARHWHMETTLGLGLRFMTHDFGIPLEQGPLKLAEHARVRNLAHRVNRPGTTLMVTATPMIARLRFEKDAQDSLWRRLRMMLGWVFWPTLGDLQAVPLPAALFPLYWVIRPVRLLRHPWRRDWRKLAEFSR